MSETGKVQTARYDLEDRTFKFAQDVIAFTKTTPKTIQNIEIIRQVVRSAGSVGANYIEANEALSKKDFIMRVKICRKEAKETGYWLRLIDADNQTKREQLRDESEQLMKIFGAILQKC